MRGAHSSLQPSPESLLGRHRQAASATALLAGWESSDSHHTTRKATRSQMLLRPFPCPGALTVSLCPPTTAIYWACIISPRHCSNPIIISLRHKTPRPQPGRPRKLGQLARNYLLPSGPRAYTSNLCVLGLLLRAGHQLELCDAHLLVNATVLLCTTGCSMFPILWKESVC